MGRPREFRDEDVIDNAVEAFWSNGYESLSTVDLADAMGVGKSSLYNTFKSKHEVLLYALVRYAELRSADVRALVNKTDITGALRTLLLDIAQNNDRRRGCLLVNTATELGTKHADVQTQLKSGFEAMQKAFAAIIESGKQTGTIHSCIDTNSLALSLVSGIAGIRVLAKSGFSPGELAPVVEVLLQQLEA